MTISRAHYLAWALYATNVVAWCWTLSTLIAR